jgi:hypothetical protein
MAKEVRVDIPNTVVANHRAGVYDRYKKTVAVSMLAASVAAVLVALAATRGIKLTSKTQVSEKMVLDAEKLSKVLESKKTRLTSEEITTLANELAASFGRDMQRLPARGAQTLASLFAPFATLFSTAKP